MSEKIFEQEMKVKRNSDEKVLIAVYPEEGIVLLVRDAGESSAVMLTDKKTRQLIRMLERGIKKKEEWRER